MPSSSRSAGPRTGLHLAVRNGRSNPSTFEPSSFSTALDVHFRGPGGHLEHQRPVLFRMSVVFSVTSGRLMTSVSFIVSFQFPVSSSQLPVTSQPVSFTGNWPLATGN